jgi:hypothetical protein
LAERIAELLRAEPDLTANKVALRVRARRRDVLRLCAALKARTAAQPGSTVTSRPGRFPKSQSGTEGER